MSAADDAIRAAKDRGRWKDAYWKDAYDRCPTCGGTKKERFGVRNRDALRGGEPCTDPIHDTTEER